MSEAKAIANHSRDEIWKMFDEISPTYDLLNHLLSFGIDVYWRRKLVKYLPKSKDIKLLDLATGTGDQLITIIKKAKQVKSALGIDMSEEMIRHGTRKIIDKSYAHQVTFMTGDATDIALKDESVDCVTMSFGIRNVVDVEKCLKECHRVLSPSGKVLILEFSTPSNKLLKSLHFFYLRHILPFIGGVISKKMGAYRYLNKTIETFPSGSLFCELLQKAGFIRIKAIPLTFGVATLYIGEKLACEIDH